MYHRLSPQVPNTVDAIYRNHVRISGAVPWPFPRQKCSAVRDNFSWLYFSTFRSQTEHWWNMPGHQRMERDYLRYFPQPVLFIPSCSSLFLAKYLVCCAGALGILVLTPSVSFVLVLIPYDTQLFHDLMFGSYASTCTARLRVGKKWPNSVLPMFRSFNFFHYAHNFIEWCHPHPSGKGQLCLGTVVDCCHQPCRHFAYPIGDAGTARYP